MYPFSMDVEDFSTRVLYLQGQDIIDTVYSMNGESKFIKNGLCQVYARLELAKPNHPELSKSKVVLTPLSIWRDIYGKKEGTKLTFEELVKQNGHVPNERASSASRPIHVLGLYLDNAIKDQNYNLNIKILSDFDGYWEYFANNFDEQRTFMPIIKNTIEEALNI